MATQGVERARFWWNRFGTVFAAEMRRSPVQAMRKFRHRRWLLDEMFLKINGVKDDLWRAVDHEGKELVWLWIETWIAHVSAC
ncbi:MAG: DDE-type integrase/transposase/recombinase [Methylobacterium sp.]|nr:DDE-type integrase/transposase/recombinase [Methylobacterium sp.]